MTVGAGGKTRGRGRGCTRCFRRQGKRNISGVDQPGFGVRDSRGCGGDRRTLKLGGLLKLMPGRRAFLNRCCRGRRLDQDLPALHVREHTWRTRLRGLRIAVVVVPRVPFTLRYASYASSVPVQVYSALDAIFDVKLISIGGEGISLVLRARQT